MQNISLISPLKIKKKSYTKKIIKRVKSQQYISVKTCQVPKNFFLFFYKLINLIQILVILDYLVILDLSFYK